MITVLISTGDWAEAATAEDAVFAAITMCDDATSAPLGAHLKPTATFLGPDGKCVAFEMTQNDLWAAAAAGKGREGWAR